MLMEARLVGLRGLLDTLRLVSGFCFHGLDQQLLPGPTACLRKGSLETLQKPFFSSGSPNESRP